MIRICTGRRASWPPLEDRVTAALLSGSHVVLLHSKAPHRILKHLPSTMTLATLFEGQDETLTRIVQELGKGRLARDIAEEVVEPVLDALESNAGSALDPTYVVYMVEYAKLDSDPPSD